jgi:chromosome partitioning protein
VEKFDYVLIDCAPSLGLLTINALVAADSVLLPLQSEYYALEGLSHLLDTVKRVRAAWNPSLDLEGVLLTMYDRRLKLSREVEADAETHLGNRVFGTRIPRNVRLSEAPSFGKPVLHYDLESPGARSYLRLAEELMER